MDVGAWEVPQILLFAIVHADRSGRYVLYVITLRRSAFTSSDGDHDQSTFNFFLRRSACFEKVPLRACDAWSSPRQQIRMVHPRSSPAGSYSAAPVSLSIVLHVRKLTVSLGTTDCVTRYDNPRCSFACDQQGNGCSR